MLGSWMAKLNMKLKHATKKRAEAWCMGCKQKRPIVVLGYQEIETRKGVTRRRLGQCIVCLASTSSFVTAK